MSHKTFLTARDISGILQISLSTAYRTMNRRDFPSIKIGKLVRAESEQFYYWLQNQK